MKITKNDPKLTAYILGELSESEAKEVFEQIKNSQELQIEVSRLKANVLQFKKLKVADSVRLNPAQREKIFAITESSSSWKKYYKLATGLAVASLAVVVFVKNESVLQKSARTDSLGSNIADVVSSKNMAVAPADTAQMKSKPAPLPSSNENADLAQRAGDKFNEAASGGAGAASALLVEAVGANAPSSPPEAAANTQPDSFAAKPAESVDLAAKEEAPKAFVAKAPSPAAMGASAGMLAKGRSAKIASGVRASGAGSSGVSYGAAATYSAKKASAKLEEESIPRKIVDIDTEKFSFSFLNMKEKLENDEIANSLLKPLYSCFENSLSRYVEYHLEITISWEAQNGKVSHYIAQPSFLKGTQKYETELYCVDRKLHSLFKNDPNLNQLTRDFKYRLILRSK